METKVYAARIKDKEELLASSSGGIFTAVSDFAISEGDAIVSAVYNYSSNRNEFTLYTSKAERDKARGSKYMQAIPGDSYITAEEWLKNNKGKVYFFGMGCQADGFRKFAKSRGLKDRVVIIDIICHGVPSPKIWNDYIGGKIEYVTFKDKTDGWKKPRAFIIRNGEKEEISEYDRIFYGDWALRPSCYKCRYATTERKVDITIGDYWGIDRIMPDFYSPDGNSLVLIHSDKGIELWKKIQSKLEYKESDLVECIQPNLAHPTNEPLNRVEFWSDYKKGGIDRILKKYASEKMKTKIVKKLKRVVKTIKNR